MSRRLEGKVAAITGSSSGVGRAIALAYAREGAFVVCSDLHPTARAGAKAEKDIATHELIKSQGSKSVFIKTDVTVSAEIEALVAGAIQEFGRLDIFVNNAGISEANAQPIHLSDEGEFDKIMKVNTKSVFLGCKYAVKQFLSQEPHPSGDRGWIINTASVLGLAGYDQCASYCASKGAVVQLTKAIAVECAPNKIHCNALCPGFIKTAMIESLTEDTEMNAELVALHPWGALGEAKDVAKAAVFLASDDAAYMTGVLLPVDGGYLAR